MKCISIQKGAAIDSRGLAGAITWPGRKHWAHVIYTVATTDPHMYVRKTINVTFYFFGLYFFVNDFSFSFLNLATGKLRVLKKTTTLVYYLIITCLHFILLGQFCFLLVIVLRRPLRPAVACPFGGRRPGRTWLLLGLREDTAFRGQHCTRSLVTSSFHNIYIFFWNF